MPLLPGWSDAAQAQLEGGNIRAAIFMRISTSPIPVRLWGGDGQFAWPVTDNVEVEGAIYTGFGLLAAALPKIGQLINGESGRVEFQLSGAAVSDEAAWAASASAVDIRNVPVDLGFILLGPDWQPMSPAAWLWEGVADSMRVGRQGSGKTPSRTITLSCASMFSGRRRPTPLFWTDYDQRQRSSTDRFCERVAFYNEGTTVPWPKST